jgi:NitT/TauT family transport system substrate-binding protein
MKTLRLETTAPFQGLAELVADKEGLFAAEGIAIEWVERDHTPRQTETAITSPDGLSAFGSHGSTFERGGADMYNACECGNYRRVQDTGVKGRQVGRRSIVVCAALVVPPDSDVFTPQQLAGKLIGVPYYFGTHYLAMQMLDGFMPRDMIKTCRAPNGSAARYQAMRNHEVAATTLTEPYISLAEKEGCRIVAEALYHGTEVISDAVDAETYAAFNRAVRVAVKRINADKRSYIHYFLDYHEGQHPGLAALTVDDFRPSRIQMVDPKPIPEDELRRTYEWMRSWDMLDDVGEESLVDAIRQSQAHGAAAE